MPSASHLFPRWTPQRLSIVTQRLSEISSNRTIISNEKRRAAVLVPLCNVNDRPSVLFTKRSENLSTHKGHVSFPGGMSDKDDKDLEATAIRETMEEIGFQVQRENILGRYHDCLSITGVAVTPIVGFLGDLTEQEVKGLPFNHAEIDSIFTLALDELTPPSKQPTSRRLKSYNSGPYLVWGLTAYILDRLLYDILLEPEQR